MPLTLQKKDGSLAEFIVERVIQGEICEFDILNHLGGCWKTLKMDFLMSSKIKSGETSTEKIRMVRAVLLDIPKPTKNRFVDPVGFKQNVLGSS